MNTRCDAYILCCIRIHTNTYIYHIQTHFFLTFRIEYDVHTLATYKHIQLHTQAYTIVTYKSILCLLNTNTYKRILLRTRLGPSNEDLYVFVFICIHFFQNVLVCIPQLVGCISVHFATFLLHL